MRARVLVSSIVVAGAIALATIAIASCGGTPFADASAVTGVRILASSADKPYAKPGDNVTVSLLAYDGRKDASTAAPMTLSWLPFVAPIPRRTFITAASRKQRSAAALGMRGGRRIFVASIRRQPHASFAEWSVVHRSNSIERDHVAHPSADFDQGHRSVRLGHPLQRSVRGASRIHFAFVGSRPAGAADRMLRRQPQRSRPDDYVFDSRASIRSPIARTTIRSSIRFVRRQKSRSRRRRHALALRDELRQGCDRYECPVLEPRTESGDVGPMESYETSRSTFRISRRAANSMTTCAFCTIPRWVAFPKQRRTSSRPASLEKV